MPADAMALMELGHHQDEYIKLAMFCLFFLFLLSIYIFGYQMMLFENIDDILGNIKCTVRVKIIYDISMVSCQKDPTRHA